MPHQMFLVSDHNPNETTGGGGCVCDPERQIDCRPPYVILPGNDMESIASPHVVICKDCAEAFVEALGGEVLSAGEDEYVLEIVYEVDEVEEIDEDELPEL